jgi:Protein of unknown function (DUF3592)
VNAAKAISAEKPSINLGCAIAIPIVVGVVFFLVGTSFFWFFTLSPLIRSLRTASWLEAQATIATSEVQAKEGDSTTYSPRIEFDFVVDDAVHHSTTWSTGFAGSSSRSRSKAIVDRYPVGSQHACFYNPNNPTDAVLDRSFQLSNLFGAFGLLFSTVGAGVTWHFYREHRKARRHQALLEDPDQHTSEGSTTSASRFSNSEVSDDSSAPWLNFSGPRKLKTEHGRLFQFLAALFFALFWNGISWTGFYFAWTSRSWFAVAFLLLFVAIGAAVIIATVYKFLQLFNPVVAIAVSNGAPQPGETLDLAWESTGLLRVVKELSFSIIGEEVVTYVRGTNTTTERKVFQRIPLASISVESEMRFGSVSVDLPQGMIHSFDASNNKIVWSVEVHGKIPLWPDIYEKMPFAICPTTVVSENSPPQRETS